MAVYGYNKPKDLHLLDDPTKVYTLAGHSQGAKMAAQFVYENPGLIDKLVLIATTHPREVSLADRSLPVLKISGSRDGVADEAAILANRGNLPADAQFVRIDGANPRPIWLLRLPARRQRGYHQPGAAAGKHITAHPGFYRLK